MVERNTNDPFGTGDEESQSPAWVPGDDEQVEEHSDLIDPTPRDTDSEVDADQRDLVVDDDPIVDPHPEPSDIVGQPGGPDLDVNAEATGMPFYTEPHADSEIPRDVLERRSQPEDDYQPRREYDLSKLQPQNESAVPPTEPYDPLDPRDADSESEWGNRDSDSGLSTPGVAGASGPVASLDDDELESTKIRRQSLLHREEEEDVEATTSWRPRVESTEREDDSSIIDEATVVPELPSRAAPRIWSFLITLLAIPAAWYLITDAAARLTLAPGNPMESGVLNPAALIELGGGLVIAIVVLSFAVRSSLGAIIFGFLAAAGGALFLAIPELTREQITPVQNWLRSWNDFGSNVAHHIEWTGYTGTIFSCGLLLFVIGIIAKLARRSGRKEEEIRTQIERMAPGTLTKKGRRK
ncbi:MAG: hypothetical protein Q4P05_02675 [Actinomycetaceae bacterium]|nr:hypothetical protein [Actinomycetaceae bacterium]